MKFPYAEFDLSGVRTANAESNDEHEDTIQAEGEGGQTDETPEEQDQEYVEEEKTT